MNRINSSWVLVLLFICLQSSAQQNFKDVYLLFDKTVGYENTVLLNGIENIDPEKTINSKNKFLNSSSDFTVGSITYDGQYFPEIAMRFNLVDDEVLVRLPIDKAFTTFKLITRKIESFEISGHYFIKLNVISETDELSGFYEQFFKSGNFRLLKKFRKKGDKELDKNFLYYEYKFKKPSYHFWYKENYYSANSRRNLFAIFPSISKEIRSFYKDRRNVRKKNPDKFMEQLFVEITNLLNLEK
ncbi:hypothetical protein [Christiangramia sp. SM2212]|uniref:Uncharacterized protein n=1 Tax=Christiangramia sediminicola TaxID=3073267 RepID=A0ABU1EPX9_9FLAO|nr:hypothetical protein [Christiangramia sp. SM2212]MDR5590440.1 hypothetical protein [Christiangramia sp. SM2212]